MKKMFVEGQECPVIIETDVLVCGGGSAGIGAAVGAAQTGSKVALIERSGCLGGMLTNGMVTSCMGGMSISGDNILIKGVWEKMVDKMVARGGAIRGYELKHSGKFFMYDESRCELELQITPFDPDAFKFSAEELMEENNVNVLYFAALIDVIKEDNAIIGVVIDTPYEKQIILAKEFIDATGDGKLMRLSKVEMDEPDGIVGPMTMCFRIGGVKEATPSFKANATDIPYGSINFFPQMRAGEHRVEMTRFPGNALKSEDLTKASFECRKQIPFVVDYLRKHVIGCEDAYMIDSAPSIGTIILPKVIGEATATEQDNFDLPMPEDRILLNAYGVDVHSSEDGGANELHWIKPGKYFGIRYGVIVPRDPITNLLAAGRLVSTEQRALGSTNGSASCMATGEAAGTTASLCIKYGKNPHTIDVKLVQEEMVKNGAILDPVKAPDDGIDWAYKHNSSNVIE